MMLTIRSTGVRRVTLAIGSFLNTPLDSTEISTVCSLKVGTGTLLWPTWAAWTIRK